MGTKDVELYKQLIERRLDALAEDENLIKARDEEGQDSIFRMLDKSGLRVIEIKREVLQDILKEGALIEEMLRPIDEPST